MKATATAKKTAPAPKTEKPEGEKPEGEKKPRAPRQDYGYRKGAILHLGEEKTYRGRRSDIYAILKRFDGKNVDKFLEAAKATLEDESARSWLKFFVTDGAARLEGGEEPKETAAE